MDDSETSSIEFKSNYPLENYFLPQGRNSLELSRGLSSSDLSSNLFSPGQWKAGSGQFQEELDFGPDYDIGFTPPPFKLQTRRTQVYTRSNDNRQLFSTQNFEEPKSDRSRSHSGEKSQSGSQKGNQDPMSPFIIHVPSIDEMAPKNKKKTVPGYSKKMTSDSKDNDNEDDNKSNSTVMQFDTENEYLTTRDNDVVIEKPIPSYDNV